MTEIIRCPECIMANFPHEWDEATRKVFGPDCLGIEDKLGNGEAWYICPECEEQINDDRIEIEVMEEDENIEFESIVPNGFVSDSTKMLGLIIEGLLDGVNYKTKDLLTAQLVDSALMLNRLTYVKNVYFDNGELAIEFSV
jgi:hypothetical protein